MTRLPIVETWLLHGTLGGGLLLLLAWGLASRCRQPARKQRLGEWGMAAALVFSVLCLGPRWFEVALWPAEPPAPDVEYATLEDDDEPASPLATPETMTREWTFRPEPTYPAQPLTGGPLVLAYAPTLMQLEAEAARPRCDAPPAVAAPADEPAAAGPPGLTFDRAVAGLTGLYLAVAGVFLGRWALGHWALRRLLKSARPAPRWAARMFVAMRPGRQRLLVSDRLRAPICCGLWRPTVVVPTPLCRRPHADTLRWVFAHELTHLERRDAWTALLFGAGQAVYFAFPWFWWLKRQVRLCQEYVADAAAAEHTDNVADYAQFLLNLTRRPVMPLAATGVAGNSSDLFRRVTMLLQSPVRVEKNCPHWWSVGSAAGLLALAVLASGVGLRAYADEEEAEGREKVLILRVADDADAAKIEAAVKDAQKAGKKVQIQVIDGGSIKVDGGKKAFTVVEAAKGAKAEAIKKAVEDAKAQGKRVHVEVIAAEAAKADAAKAKVAEALGKVAEARQKLAVVVNPETGKAEVRGLSPLATTKSGTRVIQVPAVARDRALTLRALTAAKAAEEDAKKAKKATGEFKIEFDFDNLFKNLPEGVDRDQIRKDVQKAIEQAKKAAAEGKAHAEKALKEAAKWQKEGGEWKLHVEKALKDGAKWVEAKPGQNVYSYTPASGEGRLGVTVEKPAAILIDQLDLPKGQGLVVQTVRPDSAAAKAGIKANDILLELNGKAVKDEAAALVKMLEGVKADAGFEVTVLRKGSKKTFKGESLPEKKATGAAAYRLRTAQGQQQPGKAVIEFAPKSVQGVPGLPGLPGAQGAGGKGTMISVFRNDGEFKAHQQEGKLSITVTGKVDDEGEVKVGEIRIQDGSSNKTYKTTKAVPEEHREKVKNLVEMSEKGKSQAK
jgi:beta-lactamase regulating signal transducer with metallopeptidase domain